MISRFLFILALSISILTSKSYALPWQLIDQNGQTITNEDLQKKFPDINDSQQLQSLLKEIGSLYPLENASATKTNNSIQIKIKQSLIISEIEFVTYTRQYQRQLRSIGNNYIGKHDSQDSREQIKESVLKFFDSKGYPNTEVEFNATQNDIGEVTFILKIEENKPCIIKQINTNFELPKDIEINLDAGQLCDTKKIEDSMENLDTSLRDLGFVFHTIKLEKIAYNEDKSRGNINFTGTIGPRVSYNITNTQSKFNFADIFSSNDQKGLTPNRIDADAMHVEIEKRYKDKGYIDVKVERSQISSNDKKSLTYNYEVTPNEQFKLGNVTIEGATVFSKQDIIKAMALDPFWQDSVPFNLEQIRLGIDGIKAKYQAAGYWQIKIDEPRITKNQEIGVAHVTIVINEGQIRMLDEVVFSGAKTFSPERLLEMLEAKLKSPLNHSHLVDFQQKVREFYLEEGFINAKINLKTTEIKETKSAKVKVEVSIEEGKRIKIGQIQIKGLTRTKSYVVERELRFKKGDWFSPSQLNKSRKALVNLGIFRTIQIMPQYQNVDNNSSQSVDIAISISEGDAGSVVFGPGYDIYRGFAYSAETSYNNILGTGRQISLSSSISEEKHQTAINDKTLIGRKFGIGYVEPYIFDLPIDGRISLSHKATADLFWEFVHKGEISLIHKLRNTNHDTSISVFYNQSINKAEGRPGQSQFHIISDSRIGSVGLRLNRDSRDNKGWPTNGSYFSGETAWARYALGGNINYFRWELSNNRYFALSENIVFAVGGSITSYHDIQVEGAQNGLLPTSASLNAGGPDLVRGFQKQLGPYIRRPVLTEDGNQLDHYEQDIIGGDKRLVLKTELRYLLSSLMGVSLFVDSGNAFLSREQSERFKIVLDEVNAEHQGIASLEENSQYEFHNMTFNDILNSNYYAWGNALKILTPIGSIDFSYALPWKEPKNENCKLNEDYCNPRSKQAKSYILSGRFELSVGAKF